MSAVKNSGPWINIVDDLCSTPSVTLSTIAYCDAVGKDAFDSEHSVFSVLQFPKEKKMLVSLLDQA